MGKRLFISVLAAVGALIGAIAQDYVPAPVTISKEKVKLDGKVYYSHVVLEKQTLYGISKAYDVTIEELFLANESIHLRENGLKKNSIILIPAKKEDNSRKARKKAMEEIIAEIAREHKVEKAERPARSIQRAETSDTIAQRQQAELAFDSCEEGAETEYADSTAADEIPAISPRNSANVILMLPLKAASGRGSSVYMDFYSGALLAARAKGIQGIDVNLSVYDVADGIPAIGQEEYGNADIVIGPVSAEDMSVLLGRIPQNLHAVSPMDSKTMDLALSHRNLIQANGGGDMQYADLVAWMNREYREGEKIVIVYEKGRDSDIRAVESLITESGHACSKVSYNILEGMGADVALKARMEAGQTNRVFIVSDSEAFVNDAVRNLSLLTHESAGGYRICLYGPSRIKNYETIEAENLHNVNLHLALSYNVDYDDPRVKDFLMKYRAIFRTEPTAFAYQGYDLVNFFVTAISKYGDRWYDFFTEESSAMLQADFRFESCGEEGGFVNSGLRHVVYGPDYVITAVNP